MSKEQNTRPLLLYAICFTLLGSIMTGCTGIKAILTDSTRLQTPVQNLKFENEKDKVRIIEGESERIISIKNVRWIKITPRETTNRDGRTYYLAELELKDGTKIMTYRLKDGRKSRAYVCIDDVIVAKTLNGDPIRIDLSKLSKIAFE